MVGGSILYYILLAPVLGSWVLMHSCACVIIDHLFYLITQHPQYAHPKHAAAWCSQCPLCLLCDWLAVPNATDVNVL